jgi:hypothetical protein
MVAVGAVVIGCLLFSFTSYLRNKLSGGYWRFLERNKSYYVGFARGCESIMAHHPAGTNLYVTVSPADVSVPKIIRDLRPNRIAVEQNRISIGIGYGRAGFGIAWEPQPDGQTNTWAINTYAEGLIRTPYVETRR